MKRYSVDRFHGKWVLRGVIDGSPVVHPITLRRNGTFISSALTDSNIVESLDIVNSVDSRDTGDSGDFVRGSRVGSMKERRLAGKWGLFDDDPDARRVQGQGTHLWLWVRRKVRARLCACLSVCAVLCSYLFYLTRLCLQLCLRLCMERKECQGFSLNADYRLHGRISNDTDTGSGDSTSTSTSGDTSGDNSTADPRARADADLGLQVKGWILWGNIPDMEYSDLVGSFLLTPDLDFD